MKYLRGRPQNLKVSSDDKDIQKIVTNINQMWNIINKLKLDVQELNKKLSNGILISENPPTRLVWRDDRLKAQVFREGDWQTCWQGGY